MSQSNGVAHTRNGAVGLLGPDGREFEPAWKSGAPALHVKDSEVAIAKALWGAVTSYLESLTTTRLPSSYRARDPLTSHPWIAASAMMLATVASQSPLVVLEESEQTVQRRGMVAKSKKGYWHGPPTGAARRALERRIMAPILQKLLLTKFGVEPSYDHPVYNLIRRPNPHQDGFQLQQMTHMELAINGEFFWVLTMDDGELAPIGELPTQIWPLKATMFEEAYSKGFSGELIGWWYCPWQFMPNGDRTKVFIPITDVIQFKNANPLNPLRGLSPIAAAAQGIKIDLMLKSTTERLLENRGVPHGLLTTDQYLKKEERADVRDSWKEQHQGVDNAGRLAMLWSGFKYQQLGVTPIDMQANEQQRMDREEQLALMGTPPSTLGVTDFVNYATQLGQDKNLFTKKIRPMHILEACTIERSRLFYTETDNYYPDFDISGVEALRAFVKDQIEIADRACGQNLHMTPEVAYELIGLDVPDYEGKDVALVSGLVSTVKGAMAAENEPDTPYPGGSGDGGDPIKPEPTSPEKPTGDDAPEDSPAPSDDTKSAANYLFGINSSRQKVLRARSRWTQFIKLHKKLEFAMKGAYRGWIGKEKTLTLSRYDAASNAKGFQRSLRGASESLIEYCTNNKNAFSLLDNQVRAEEIGPMSNRGNVNWKTFLDLLVSKSELNLSEVLPDIKKSADALKAKSRPVYAGALEGTYKFTLDEIGIPTWGIDDPKLIQFFDKREAILLKSVPKTVYDNLATSLKKGIQEAETVQQLRLRIAEVYDVAAGTPKTLMVARTEMTGLMNGLRDEMFELQGFKLEDWVDAGDEHTRANHVIYGESGPQKPDFNYLTLVGVSTGSLMYPGDVNAPAGEVINCRCLKIPVDDDK